MDHKKAAAAAKAEVIRQVAAASKGRGLFMPLKRVVLDYDALVRAIYAAEAK